MDPIRRLIIAITGLVSITAIGTVGYVLLEPEISWLDALYMTVITISTVGYGEVKPLHPAGQFFTIGLIVTGVGGGLYLLASLAEIFIEGRMRDVLERKAMQRKIENLSGHTIICGFGRLGQVVVEELSESDAPLVVIEMDAQREAELIRAGVLYVLGSALSDEVLEQAGIRRANDLVVATSSDSDNVFVTLSSRELNPKIRVHARGESKTVSRRLRLAGAHQVISAYQMGGMRLASSLLRPSVVDFLEISRPRRGEGVDLEEIHIAAGSPLSGRNIGSLEAEAPRVRIVALKRADDPIRIIPDAETQVAQDDNLVVIGERPSLEKLARQAQGVESV